MLILARLQSLTVSQEKFEDNQPQMQFVQHGKCVISAATIAATHHVVSGQHEYYSVQL
jgi:hypothetical protein